MRNLAAMIVCILLSIVVGCSSGGSPVIPGASSPSGTPQNISIDENPVFVSSVDNDGNPSEGMGVMGLFNLSITPDNAELTPVRRTSLEDVLESVDITNFLKLAPCTDCVKIRSVALDDDSHLVVSIGIKHPFPAGDPFKPISGRNRADLHVFNVEGTVISNAPATTFSGINANVAGGFKLVNADGYTSYLDGAIDEFYPTDATIHPYILHFDDYTQGNFDAGNPMGFESVTNPSPSGNLVMPMGCDYNFQDYVFDIEDNSSFDFIYAVGCTYAVSSAAKFQRFNPEYRVPQHNKKAASEVRVEITRNGLAAGTPSSSADLAIKVLDINHGVAVGTALNEMRADSSVGSIQVELPGVLNTPFSGSVTPVSGNGRDPADLLVFIATITNEASANIGTYSGLVKVTDTYAPGLNASPLLNGQDGIKRVGPIENPLQGLFAINEFATYAVFTIDVTSSNLPPLVELLVECENVYSGGWTVLSVGSGTADQDGNNLVLYEFDFDYDGITFDVDASNTTGDSVTTPQLINDTGSPITRTFALRVTDDGVPPASGIGTVDITLHPASNSNGKNLILRPGSGVEYRDLGVNKTTGEIIVGFSDNQVWKYAPDYSTGALFYTIPDGSIHHLDIAANGYSLVRSDTPERSLMYTPTGSLNWNGNQGITYTSGVTELNGTWSIFGAPANNMLIILTNWPVFGDVRWFQKSYVNYDGYYGLFTTNFEGEGGFDSMLTLGFDFKNSPANMSMGEVWTLEGAPRYELELSTVWFTYLNKTIGLDGGQSDDLDGFNDPKDVVLDSNDRVYVLDLLSNGMPVIKLYTALGDPIAIFGICGEIGGNPIAIESDEGDGEIHVLHTNGVSVFYPSEIP